MTTVLNEMANVNVAKEKKFDSILAVFNDEEEKTEEPNSKAEDSTNDDESYGDVSHNYEGEGINPNDETKKKKKPPSVEFNYIMRKKPDGKRVTSDYRRDGGKIYFWTNEYWKEMDDEALRSEINVWLMKFYPADYSSRNLNSTLTMFKNAVNEFSNKNVDRIIIPTKMHWLIVDEITGVITAVKPRKWLAVKTQVDMIVSKPGIYVIPKDPIKGTSFEKYLNSSIPEKDTQEFLANYSGYSLTNSTRKQKGVMFVGSGANGKGIFIEVLSSVHGNPVSISLAEIGKYNDNLPGASLIFATECDSKGGFNESFFKAAVSGDQMEVRGIYGAKKTVRINGKWVLICNSIPHISDFSDAIYRRTIVVEFKNQFLGDAADENLARNIIKYEKKAFLHWCLDGLQKMIVNKWKFTESKSCNEAMSNWKLDADKLRMFLSENEYIFDDDVKTRKEMDKKNFFALFNNWADQNNFENMNSSNFWKRLNLIFPDLKKYPNIKSNSGRTAYIRKK